MKKCHEDLTAFGSDHVKLGQPLINSDLLAPAAMVTLIRNRALLAPHKQRGVEE